MTRHQATVAPGTAPDHSHPATAEPVTPFVNITSAERLGRILIGVAGIVTAIVLLLSAGSAVAVVLEVLLLVAGADMLVTGARGHCPLYARLRHLPRSLSGAR